MNTIDDDNERSEEEETNDNDYCNYDDDYYLNFDATPNTATYLRIKLRFKRSS